MNATASTRRCMTSANQSKENHTLPEHIHGVTFAPFARRIMTDAMPAAKPTPYPKCIGA